MLDTPLKEGLISTLYNVSGIMFSIGLGLIVSFNLSGIRNREYIKEIRKNIHSVLPNSIQLLVEIGAMLGENIIHMVECL